MKIRFPHGVPLDDLFRGEFYRFYFYSRPYPVDAQFVKLSLKRQTPPVIVVDYITSTGRTRRLGFRITDLESIQKV